MAMHPAAIPPLLGLPGREGGWSHAAKLGICAAKVAPSMPSLPRAIPHVVAHPGRHPTPAVSCDEYFYRSDIVLELYG